MFGLLPIVTFAAFCASSVHGHGLITAATGANGVTGKGFAVVDGTPRDTGLPIKAVEGDTSIIRDNEIASGKVGGCGRTEFGGSTDVAKQLAASAAAGMPTVGADGTVTMTIHQVNQDGAGPYACDVNADGTGNSFVAMQVSKNVPGAFLGLSTAAAKDFQVTAAMPAGTKCTGGPNGDACVVRCRNQALAGPFGGCIAVAQQSAGTAAAGTAAAGTAAAGTAAAGTAAAGTAAAGTAAANTAAAGTAAGTASESAAGGAGGAAGGLLAAFTGGKGGKKFIRSRIVARRGAMWV
jgi:hypothetical protein